MGHQLPVVRSQMLQSAWDLIVMGSASLGPVQGTLAAPSPRRWRKMAKPTVGITSSKGNSHDESSTD